MSTINEQNTLTTHTDLRKISILGYVVSSLIAVPIATYCFFLLTKNIGPNGDFGGLVAIAISFIAFWTIAGALNIVIFTSYLLLKKITNHNYYSFLLSIILFVFSVLINGDRIIGTKYEAIVPIAIICIPYLSLLTISLPKLFSKLDNPQHSLKLKIISLLLVIVVILSLIIRINIPSYFK